MKQTKFSYTAYNNAGTKQRGVILALTQKEALDLLQAQQLSVISLSAVNASTPSLFAASNLSLADIEFFTSELALLLRSGLNIDRGIQLLNQNAQSDVFRQFTQTVYDGLKRGQSLSEILADYKAFSALYISLVRIAEETGEMISIFDKLSEEIKYQVELRAKISQALAYPAVILFVCITALLFIFNFVVPNMSSLFRDQVDLPIYTQALLNMSSFMNRYQWYLLAFLSIGGWTLWNYRHHPQVEQMMNWSKTHLPMLKTSGLLLEQVRFNSALAIMLSTGLSIDKALLLATDTVTVPNLRAEIKLALENIKKGEGLAQSLRQTKLFPPYFASLLAIGEESGELGRAFQEISDRSRTAFYKWVTRFTTLLEPLLILFMGAIVGSVVVIMMLSITAVTDVPI